MPRRSAGGRTRGRTAPGASPDPGAVSRVTALTRAQLAPLRVAALTAGTLTALPRVLLLLDQVRPLARQTGAVNLAGRVVLDQELVVLPIEIEQYPREIAPVAVQLGHPLGVVLIGRL